MVNESMTPGEPLLCIDVGSTWTKAALISEDGELLGTAQHPTTPPEVLTGIANVTAALDGDRAPALACSSAGGGLRLAVVGQEPMVSAEAGKRVALSAGARVVHVHAGDLDGRDLDGRGLRALRAARPDVLLLVGGTDGGDTRTLLHNAARLAVNRIRPPIVLAGNAAVRDDALALLRSTNRTVVVADNVLPDVGELNPGPARHAIREVFLQHVIGGKGRVLVVDVGGATTDVYSAVSTVDGRSQHAAGQAAQQRTVEGDLGMRVSAVGVVTEAINEKLVDADAISLRAAAMQRAGSPGLLPSAVDDARIDCQLAVLAAVIAIRRHLRMIDGQLGRRGADLLVLSGGVFRHASAAARAELCGGLKADPVLRHAAVRTDTDLVLAAAGLLVHAGLGAAADALAGRRL